jgi:hypothetical protein
MNLTGTAVTRVDKTVNFSWGTAAPVAGIPADGFSVRWTGQLLPQYTETYTFRTTSDDGVRLWVNGQLLVDHWTDHGSAVDAGSIALTVGQKVDLRMEYYDHTGGAVAQLTWSSPSTPAQTIPTTQLFPAAPGP